MRNTFSKKERLCSKKLIEFLLQKGNSFFVHPFKVVHLITSLPEPVPSQVLLGVSKRHYKTAFQRNTIKRHMRETFRTNKHDLNQLLTKQQKQLALAIICTAPDQLVHTKVEEKVLLILQKLSKEYESR